MRPTALGVALSTLTLASAASAQNAVPSTVVVAMPDCADAMDDDRLETLLRVELIGDGVGQLERVDRHAEEADGSLARITVAVEVCEAGAAELTITIDDAATQKVVRRAVSLAEVEPSARARTLSLSIAELLRASWAELSMPNVPPSAVTVPLPVRSAVAVTLRPEEQPRGESPEEELSPIEPAAVRRRLRIELAGLMRSFPGASTSTFGARGGVSFSLVGPLRLHLDGEASAGESLDRLGRVELSLIGGGLGLGVEVVAAPFSLDVSARAVLGLGTVSGTPYDASTTSGNGSEPVLLLGAEATLHAEIIEALELLLGVDIGGAALGLDALADGRAIAGFSGIALAVRVGLAWSP